MLVKQCLWSTTGSEALTGEALTGEEMVKQCLWSNGEARERWHHIIIIRKWNRSLNQMGLDYRDSETDPQQYKPQTDLATKPCGGIADTVVSSLHIAAVCIKSLWGNSKISKTRHMLCSNGDGFCEEKCRNTTQHVPYSNGILYQTSDKLLLVTRTYRYRT